MFSRFLERFFFFFPKEGYTNLYLQYIVVVHMTKLWGSNGFNDVTIFFFLFFNFFFFFFSLLLVIYLYIHNKLYST